MKIVSVTCQIDRSNSNSVTLSCRANVNQFFILNYIIKMFLSRNFFVVLCEPLKRYLFRTNRKIKPQIKKIVLFISQQKFCFVQKNASN